MTDPYILSVRQAAEIVGVDRHTLRNWLDDPEIRAAFVLDTPGRQVRISRPKLLRWLGAEVRPVSSREPVRTVVVREPAPIHRLEVACACGHSAGVDHDEHGRCLVMGCGCSAVRRAS